MEQFDNTMEKPLVAEEKGGESLEAVMAKLQETEKRVEDAGGPEAIKAEIEALPVESKRTFGDKIDSYLASSLNRQKKYEANGAEEGIANGAEEFLQIMLKAAKAFAK